MTTVRELRKQLKSLDQDATIQSWSAGETPHTTSPDTSFAELQNFASNLAHGLATEAKSHDTHNAIALAIFLREWIMMGPDNIDLLQKQANFMALKV